MALLHDAAVAVANAAGEARQQTGGHRGKFADEALETLGIEHSDPRGGRGHDVGVPGRRVEDSELTEPVTGIETSGRGEVRAWIA